MTRYILCSKRDNIKTFGWQSLHNYFELGWEMAATHLDAKHLIATGQTTDEDVIVTLEGREFLYQTLIKTMPYEKFAEERGIHDASRIQFDDVLDLTYHYARTSWIDTDIYHGGPNKTYLYPEDLPLILDMNVPEVPDIDRYAVACWRYRHNHSADRNTPADHAREINDWLVKKYGKVFVVGHETENLCNGDTIVHVDLPTFAGLARDPRCQMVLGAMTGTLQLAAIICSTRVVAYQHNPRVPDANDVNHPVVFGECVNLRHNKRRHFYAPQTPVSELLPELDHWIETT